MADSGEIKIIEENFSSAKSSFDEKREAISTEKNTYDNATRTLYENWKGQAMNACISVTDKLNTDYINIIDNAEKLSKNMESILEIFKNTDNSIANTYQLGNSMQGEK